MANKKTADAPTQEELEAQVLLAEQEEAAKAEEEARLEELRATEATAAQRKLDAETTLAAAKADLDAAEAEHTAAVAAFETKAVYGEDILVDFGRNGSYTVVKAPPNWVGERPRSLQLGRVNVEHVSENVDGIWQYRAM